MKSNQSSKNFKSTARVLTIVICIGLAFSLVTVQQSEALLGILIACGIGFIAGGIVSWLTHERHDSTSPDALITSEENYVAVWNDFLEDWNNDYMDENIDLHNYMMMFNLTYLDSVRRAEHDVASYVDLTSWEDVENNMSSLIGYKENITKFMVSTLHGYNRIDVSILQHIYDTDVWSYTTPMKYAFTYYNTHLQHEWAELCFYGSDGGSMPTFYQYKVPFGTYPVGYDGDYDIGDKFYVTYIYVPNGNYITLKNLDSNEETTYSDGVHDLQGEKNEVINVTTVDYGFTDPNLYLDRTGVYLFGVPTDFNVLEDNFITYDTGLSFSTSPQSIVFETDKFINEFTYHYFVSGGQESVWARIYIDGDLFYTQYSYLFGEDIATSFTINDYVHNITIVPIVCKTYISDIKTEGYIYHDMTGGLRVDTEHAGSADVTDNLPIRARVGLDWMVNSYKNIYTGMVINAKILWNLYHANGWYSTDDIPSEFLVIPPDIIFDNLDALTNLPLDKAQAIYYAWMAQLIDFYDENPDYKGTYDDTNMTVFDDGIIINATLVHGTNTIFSNHQIYISPLLGDLEICKDNYYNLTQKIFIYDITGTYIYYGYVGDNLTIYNITVEGFETECVTLGRQTMHDFLLGKYGFTITFTGEWQFPVIENIEIYMSIAIACFGFGIPIAIFGKKYRPIGYLLIVVGTGIIIYVYVIPAIQSFIDMLIFWD